MLTLTRRRGQWVRIYTPTGDVIEVAIVHFYGTTRAELAIQAPATYRVWREEIDPNVKRPAAPDGRPESHEGTTPTGDEAGTSAVP